MEPESIHAVILDDEKDPGLLLENLLTKHPVVKILGRFRDPDEGVRSIVSLKPDMVFLDIRMPGKDGFQVLDELRNTPGVAPTVIFTTAFEEYALKAFEYAAFDYLLKPVEPDRLAEVLTRYQKLHEGQFAAKAGSLLSTIKKLVFRSHTGIIFVDPSDIMYCQAEGNYTNLYFSPTEKETITVQLGQLECQLRDYHFFRTSRSFLINLTYLKKTDRRKCQLEKNGMTVMCDIAHEKIQDLITSIQQ